MNWLTFTLAAVLINTTLGLGLRKTSKGSSNPRIMGLIYNCYAALMSMIIWIVSGAGLPHNLGWPIIGLTLLSILGYGIFQRGQFYLRKNVEVSELTPVMQSGLIAGFAASIIILNEPLSTKKLLGAGIILTATLLVSLNRKLAINKYALFAIGIASALYVAGVFDKLANPHYPIFFYAMLIWTVPLPFIAYPTTLKDIRIALKEINWRIPLLASLNALSLVFVQRAFQLGEVSRVIPVLSTVTVLTVLGGIIILGEKDNWQRKVLAGILATIGILILR